MIAIASSCQKPGLDKILGERLVVTTGIDKLQASKKIIFEKIKLIFDLENWLWKLKMPNFWQLIIISVYKTSKFPLTMYADFYA